MGLVLMLYTVPILVLLLVNLYFYFYNFKKVSKSGLKKSFILGLTLAITGLVSTALRENVYMFSFIFRTIVVVSTTLLVSLIFYLKKDKLAVNKGLYINTTLFVTILAFLIGMYFTKGFSEFHY